MMNRKNMLVFAALTAVNLAIPTAANAEAWLCIGDKATGFKYDPSTKEWQSANFKISNSRYILKETPDLKNPWEYRRFGNEGIFPEGWCETGFSEYGFINCTGLGGSFVMNRNTGRYQIYFSGGYFAYNPKSDDESLRKDGGETPYIEIGNCSKI